jgi:hypothetical protein
VRPTKSRAYYEAKCPDLLAEVERLRKQEERFRSILGRYPEMTDIEAAKAAGDLAALLFREQGVATKVEHQ